MAQKYIPNDKILEIYDAIFQLQPKSRAIIQLDNDLTLTITMGSDPQLTGSTEQATITFCENDIRIKTIKLFNPDKYYEDETIYALKDFIWEYTISIEQIIESVETCIEEQKLRRL